MPRYRICVTVITTILSVACGEFSGKQSNPPQSAANTVPVSTVNAQSNSSGAYSQRFLFPPNSAPFIGSSVSLDTTTGRLCKTYDWHDTPNVPSGLHLCSEATSGLLVSGDTRLIGAKKFYRGHTYTFDGKQWKKGTEATKFNEDGSTEPLADDQYDPVGLFTKEEKAKSLLTEVQIRRVAQQFHVSYEEAWEDAKAQGYKVPPKRQD